MAATDAISRKDAINRAKYYLRFDDTGRKEMIKALNSLPAVATEAARWTSVKDEMPRTDGSYLICTMHGAVCQTRYYKQADTFGGPKGRCAAYWMPMPKSPMD